MCLFFFVHQVSAVSAIVNRGLPLKAYVFRNYRLMPGVRSHYLGDCKHKMWQAIRASSAAPGYFEEFVLGKDLHQVGHVRTARRLTALCKPYDRFQDASINNLDRKQRFFKHLLIYKIT